MSKKSWLGIAVAIFIADKLIDGQEKTEQSQNRIEELEDRVEELESSFMDDDDSWMFEGLEDLSN